jgi:P4 family phage/plasmid primase-like protien
MNHTIEVSPPANKFTASSPPPKPVNFRLSLFRKVADNEPQEAARTWEEFCARLKKPEVRAGKDGPLFSPAIFEPKARAKANVSALSMLALDCDHHNTLDSDLPRWRKLGYAYAAYTTHSHKRVTKSNPNAEERFRVVLPLAAPIPPIYYPALWAWAFHASGEKLDPSPKDASRIFYTPAKASEDAEYYHEIHDGPLLDWQELPPVKYVVKAFEGEIAKLLATQEGRNNQLFKSAAALGELVAGGCLDEDRVIDALEDAAVKIGLDVDENCGPKGISDTIQSGLRTGRKKPRAPESFNGNGRPAPTPEPTSKPEEQAEETAVDTVFDESKLLADFGNATRFLDSYRDKTRYVYPEKKFYCFNNKRWSNDQGLVEDWANRTIKSLKAPAEDLPAFKHYLKSQSPERRSAMLALARAEIRIDPDEFDADPDLLNVWNGTIHLPTGEFRKHSPKDFCTKISKVEFDKDAQCPQWIQFLQDIFSRDNELIAFNKRAVGYSLSGWIIEQKLFLLYGIGKNGKSTFLNILKALLGAYTTHAQMSVFMSRKDGANGHSESLANLAGARLVTAVETEESRRLSEGLIKQVTGSDSITASRKGEHEITFTPRFKLWLAANHKPVIRGTDDGIWRRPMLIPFLQQFETDPEKVAGAVKLGDPKLEIKLLAELPGILNWALEGYREWAEQGLRPPEAVRAATDAYRKESDILGTFIEEELIQLQPTKRGNSAGDIYKAYCKWCEANGETPLTQTKFGRELSDVRGYQKKKEGGTVWYWGLGLPLKQDSQDSQDSSSGRNPHEKSSCSSPSTTVLTVPTVLPVPETRDLQPRQNSGEDPNITPEGYECPF